MKTVAILFNGIRLPYEVIDQAIKIAKENNTDIYALFLKGSKEQQQGYIFPSDLETTEISTADDEAVNNDEAIIVDNIDFVKKRIEDENISYHYDVKTNASLNEVAALLADAGMVIADKFIDEPSILSDDKIELKKLAGKLEAPFELI